MAHRFNRSLIAGGRLAACLCALFLLTSCGRYIPFTMKLRTQFQLDAAALRGVQFYVSSGFTLRRDVTRENQRLSPGGVLRTASGRLVEEIVVKKCTPGIALRVDFTDDPPKAALAMSFMPGDNQNTLVFAMTEDPQPDSEAPFLLMTTLWEGQSPRISYDNKVWSLEFRKRPQLLVKKAAFFKPTRIIRILPGRVVE